MQRQSRFEHARYIGDKRTQLVYDLDVSGVGIQFGPDTLAEARNRGYTLARPGSRRIHRTPRT